MLVSVSDLVLRLSEELVEASTDVENIEVAVSLLQQAGGNAMLANAMQLQRLDLLRQRLQELARFLRTVKPAAGESQYVDAADALAAMLLSDLRHRLQGGSPIPAVATGGDFDLLD